MKRVSFNVANAIKKADYPQNNEPITNIGWYNIAGIYTKQLPTYWEGDNMFVAIAPTYLEVWLWLWREKGFKLSIVPTSLGYIVIYLGFEPIYGMNENVKDPEEAIIAAIENLVDNDLIK